MKIEIGSETKNIEIRTPQQFSNATRHSMLRAQVFSVTTTRDHADLIKTLGLTGRPYAVSLLVVK